MLNYIKKRIIFLKRKVYLYFYRIINPFILILLFFFSVPFIFIIRILKPWIHIRFGTFNDRLGDFAYDAGKQWASLSEKPSKQIDWYWIQGEVSNTQLDKMVRRNFKIFWWVRYLDYWNNFIPGGSNHHRPRSFPPTRDITGIIERAKVKMEFHAEEDQKAIEWLYQQGWTKGEPFVCLIVRDEAYNELDHQFALDNNNWQYQSFRNTEIETYIPAMEWLADQRVWVFRMGKIMKKPMLSNHKKIIDYAFHPQKSDFLDIWILANCNLCISVGTGPDAISDIYRRPILFLNYIPLGEFRSWSNAMHVPKTLVWESSNVELTCQEYLNNIYFNTNAYKNAGIKIKDLTSKEILLSTQECWQRIQDKWRDTEEDCNKQKKFWKILEQWPDFSKWHGWKHSNSRLGSLWLRDRKNDFLQKTNKS